MCFDETKQKVNTSFLSEVKKRSLETNMELSLEQGLQLLYGHGTWWMESSLDANNSESQVKVKHVKPASAQH